MASAGSVLALVTVLAASAGSQQLGLLSPTSIAVNNPGELGLVSPQQAAAAAAAAIHQQTQNGQHLLYPALYTPYSYYPGQLLQQNGLMSDLQSQLLQNSYQLNRANALAQPQQHPQSPFVPGYAYLIANNPYQMVGSSVGHQPLQSYDSTQLAFNDLYHQGYVSPDHLSQILGTQSPNFHQQQYHQPFPHQHHSQDTGQYLPGRNVVEPNLIPQREAPEQENHHQSTTTTTPAPTPPPTRPPTFRTFQGKDYRANPSRRPSNRGPPKPNRAVDSSTTRPPPTRTAYTTTYNPYVFQHDSPTRRTFYDHGNNTQDEIKPIITTTIATPINPEISTTQKPDIPDKEERKIYIRHTTKTPEYLNSEQIRNSAPQNSDDHDLVDDAWSGGKSFTSAREHTPPPLSTEIHGVQNDPSINSQSYESTASISSDDPFYFEALTNFDHTGYYVPPPRSPPNHRHLPEYLPYSPLRDSYRPVHVTDHHAKSRYQPYWNPASHTDEVYFELDPHFDFSGPPHHFGVGGNEPDEYDHSKEHALTSIYDIHSPTYKEGYGKPTYKPTLSQDSLDKIYDQNHPKSIINQFVTTILPSNEIHNTKILDPVRITTPISNYEEEGESNNRPHGSFTLSPIRPTLQPTPFVVSPSFSPTPPSNVVKEPATVRQYATAWPITPPPSYSPDRSKRPFRLTSQLPQNHQQKVHLNEHGKKVIEIQPQFRDNYRRRQQTQHHPLPPQLRPHVVNYEQFPNGKTLEDAVAPEAHLPVEQGPPIPPNIPLVYHPNVFGQNLHNQGGHGASIEPPPLRHRQRVRNYNAPDLEGPANHQTDYNSPNEAFSRHKDTKIREGSKEYAISNYADRNDTGTSSGVYFSPLVTLAPPTTPHTYREEYDDRKHYSQESPFANAISRRPASNFRSYSASPLPETADTHPLLGYKSGTDLDVERLPLVQSIPHQNSSPTQRPYEAILSTSAIYHAPPPISSKLIPVPVNPNAVGSRRSPSRAKNSNDQNLVFEDGQYNSPYTRPKIEPYHEPIQSTPYYQHEPLVAQYPQPRIHNYADDINVLVSPYYAARTLKFSGPNEALNEDAFSFLPHRGLGRGRLRRRRKPLWMRLAGRIEHENEFSYHPVVYEGATDAANEFSYHSVVQEGASDAAKEFSYNPVVQEGATDAANEFSYHSVVQRGATDEAIVNYDVPPTPPSSPQQVSDETDPKTPNATPPTPPQARRESDARPVIDLDRSETQGLRELRHTDAIGNVAFEEQGNGLQHYKPDEFSEFPSLDIAPDTVETAKKRRKQYKHTTPKTAKPRTAAEVKRSHLRQHQQLLQNTKLQPPERKEAWKAKRRTTTTISSLKNKYAAKRSRGVPSDNEDMQDKKVGEEKLAIDNQEELQKSSQHFTPRRQTPVSQDTVRRPQPTRRRSTTTAPPPTPQENTTLSTGYSLEHLYAPFLKQLQDWDAKNGK